MMAIGKQVLTIVYVGNAESNDIHVYQLHGETGDLVLTEKVAIPGVLTAGISTPLAISPDKRFLFAGMRGEPLFAASFTINPDTGRLTYVASGPLADRMAYIVTDRTGKFLLSASYPGHKVAVNPIAADGSVQPPVQIVPTEPHAHAILPDPANRYVLATSLGGDLIKQFRFDAATGRLSPNEPAAARVKEKAGPRHFVFHPTGKLVYLLNELDASVCVFDYDPTRGQLALKQMVSALPPDFTGKPSAADVHLTPDGRFLYASERTSSTLAAFKVGPGTGTLAPLGSTPTEEQPRGFNIDPSGRYLLAVGQLSHRMSSYTIDPDSGKLTKLKEYPMGRNPNWVEIITLP
jgi:6-phosphogluconolactonase